MDFLFKGHHILIFVNRQRLMWYFECVYTVVVIHT